MLEKFKRLVVIVSITVLVGLALKGIWYYLTVTMISYGPFEVQVVTPEPMDDIVLVMGYDHGRTFGLRNDIYREVRVVSSGEKVKLPMGVFQYGGKPRMRVSLYHPRLKSSTMPAFTPDAWEHWDGGSISFSIKAPLWQGFDVSTHLMRMNNAYLKYFPKMERKNLSKYADGLEQGIEGIDSASNTTDAYHIRSAREELERFKTETQ